LLRQLFNKELIKSRPLKVVAVAGGTRRPSRMQLAAESAAPLFSVHPDNLLKIARNSPAFLPIPTVYS